MKINILIDIIRLNRHYKRLIIYNKRNVYSLIAGRLTIKITFHIYKINIYKKLHRRSNDIIEE